MLDLNHTYKSNVANVSLKSELLNFCDEFTEYNDYCAFFCESVSLIAGKNEPIDKETSQGLKRYALSMKDKAQFLQLWLQEIQSME